MKSGGQPFSPSLGARRINKKSPFCSVFQNSQESKNCDLLEQFSSVFFLVSSMRENYLVLFTDHKENKQLFGF